MQNKNNQTELIKQKNVKIILISSLIGIVSGLIIVLYRIVLTQAESLSFSIYHFVSNNKVYIPLLLIALSLIGYFIGALVQKYPLISGGGIPQVKARIMGYIHEGWFSTLIAKFIGGALSILCGLSLGRKGPSIQLGACVGQGISDCFDASNSEKRIYIASGASAGLAAAFNTPLAGVMFALEEVFRYFSPMVLLSTIIAASFADFISKLLLGVHFIFNFDVIESVPIQYYWLFILLGIFLGIIGVLHNKISLLTQTLYKKLNSIPSRWKMSIPFVFAGIIGLTFPIAICGGYSITETLNIETSISFLIVVFLVKFILSMVSFGSGAPGGIFFPLLVLGSTLGAIFAQTVISMFGLDSILFYNFVIIAMAGYFTAIVRAPLTGVILIIEMTNSLSQLLPLIITSAVAYVIAEELKCKPIYESLFERLLENRGIKEEVVDKTKILIEKVVQIGSSLDGHTLKEITLPKNCLIVSIKRGQSDITPQGDTVIKGGDSITALTSVSTELEVSDCLEQLCQFK